jgi:pimeloyl-ACP methyl ester carboxylesterase
MRAARLDNEVSNVEKGDRMGLRSWGRRWRAGVVVVAVSGSACVVASAAHPATGRAVRAAAAPVTTEWMPCGNVSCARVRVPLDWSHPAGKQITIGVARHAAARPDQRVGTLFFSTGLTGSALDTLATNYPRLPAVLRERFDLVAVGQRGYPHRSLADTTVLDCGNATAWPTTLFPRSDAEYDGLVNGNRALYAGCRANSGALVRHLDVDAQARDWDAVRAMLGQERISVLTFVGAGAVGQNYAARFPRRIRAMALDGPLNRSATDERAYVLGAATTQRALQRFSAWCAATPPVPNPPPIGSSPTAGCAIHGQDAVAAYQALIAEAPLTVPGIDHRLGGEEIAGLLSYFLVNGNVAPPGGGWVDLAATLRAAQDGNPVGLATMYAASRGLSAAVYGKVATCSIVAQPSGGYQAMRARIERVRRAGGDTRGQSSVWENSVGCTGWPVTALPPLRTAQGLPATLVLSTDHDLYSPAPDVAALARRLPGSVVLRNDDDGHIAYLQSPCVADVTNDYLVTVRAPAAGMVCRPGATEPQPR